jgi:hypothetical protein
MGYSRYLNGPMDRHELRRIMWTWPILMRQATDNKVKNLPPMFGNVLLKQGGYPHSGKRNGYANYIAKYLIKTTLLI